MKVEQLLHGYHNGHHLIAGSVYLSAKDADRASYMSDWTDYVNPFDGKSSYLTAYPLSEAPYYVIARSWYAQEMSRPGCVWTHSLLVKFESLEAGVQLENLEKLFRRPALDGEVFDSYTKSLEISDEVGSEENKRKGLLAFEPTRLLFCMAELYRRSKMQAYGIEGNSDLYDLLCMRLIQFVPFGILQELSFCSGTASIRKIGEKPLSLQFVNGRKESLFNSLPENAVRPTVDKGFGFWIDSMLAGRTDVAQLIHNFSGEIGGDSQRFLAVMNLLYILDNQLKDVDQKIGIREVLQHLTGEFKEPSSGAKLKKSFLSKSVSSYFCGERDFLRELAITSVSSNLDYASFGYQQRALAYRDEKGIDEYLTLISDLIDSDSLNKEGQSLVRHALDCMSVQMIKEISDSHWKEFVTIASLNEQLLAEDYWLDMPDQKFLMLFDVFQRHEVEEFKSWVKLFDRLLTIDTEVSPKLIAQLKKQVEGYVRKALDVWNNEAGTSINRSLTAMVVRETSQLLSWMTQQNSLSSCVRELIKQFVSLDSEIVIQNGSRCWKAYVDSELNDVKDANMLTFVYQLSFGWRDANSLDYLRRTLPVIYEAIATEQFSRSSWYKIERYTGKVSFWRDWDYCRKLLVGVRDYCKQMNLSLSEVRNFTWHQKLNNELLELYK